MKILQGILAVITIIVGVFAVVYFLLWGCNIFFLILGIMYLITGILDGIIVILQYNIEKES